jgi:hypothetical protein
MHTQTRFKVILDLLIEVFEDLDNNDFNPKFDMEFRALKKITYTNTVCMIDIVRS